MTDDNITPERIAKLPGWARDHIATLTSANAHLERSLTRAEKAASAYGSGLVDVEPSGFAVEVDNFTYEVPKGGNVTARIGGHEFELTIEDHALRVVGPVDLAVLPQSSFEIAVRGA